MKLMEKLSYLGVVLPSFSSHAPANDFYDAISPGGGTRVSMYRTFPSTDDFFDGWSRLAGRPSATGAVFQSPAWQTAIARPFARVGRYRLLAVHAGAAIRAILPLQIGAGGVLETPGEMISDYLEPLVDSEGAQDSWRLMLGLLRAQCVDESISVVLHNLPADGSCRTLLTSLASDAGFQLADEPAASAARISLPATWEDYLAALASRDRKELKRKIKKATAEMGARLEVSEAPPRVTDDLHAALAMVEQAGGRKGFKARWSYRPIFKRAAADLTSAEMLRVYTLLLKDQPAAAIIAFPSAGGALAWAAGFNSDAAKYSPGIVLFGLAIQHAIARGDKFFDLLRGQSRYKQELGAAEYPVRRLTLTPSKRGKF